VRLPGTRAFHGVDTESRCLVTGVAGFIGSHLAEALIARGAQVVGVDCFTDYYARAIKERNLVGLRTSPRFRFVEASLVTADLGRLVDGTDYVFHQAGQAGVRASWEAFTSYTENNIVATKRLLDAVQRRHLRRFVFASSSSVYGDAEELPTPETALPKPVSPYGVTKLAAEHLCLVYARNFHIPTVALRYFSVYGPRQRPDMAFHKLITALLDGKEFSVYGDGEQTRDFTYVADAVEANLLAAAAPLGRPSAVFNIGGGSRTTLNRVIQTLEGITGKTLHRVQQPAQLGDANDTYADSSAARRELGFRPGWSLSDGLAAQVRSMQEAMAVV
jgi:UDP-glucose 4-epimerase